MTIILFIVLIIGFLYLKDRINDLQSQVDQLSNSLPNKKPAHRSAPADSPAISFHPTTPPAISHSKLTPTPTPTQPPEVPPAVSPREPIATMPAAVAPPSSTPTPITDAPAVPNPFVEWCKENTLIKVGALIFFLGAVWFVSYAITQGWISEFMRIALGILLGVGVLALGHLRRSHNTDQYLTLTTLGASIVIASVYTGQLLFNVFDPLTALLVLLATIAYTVFVSIQENAQWLAVSATIAALIAPLLTNAPAGLADLFFYYLAMISVCFLLVQRFRPWRSIPLTLALGVSYYQVAYYAEGAIDASTLWWYVIFFTTTFFIANVINLTREQTPQPLDVTLFGLLAVNFVGWVSVLVVAQSLVTFTAAFVVACTGYWVYLRTNSQTVTSLFAGLSGLLTLLGTSYALDGYTLTIAFALEIGIALMVASYLRFSDRVVMTTASLYLLPIATALLTYRSSDWRSGIFHDTGYALYGLLLVSVAVSIWFVHLQRQRATDLVRQLAGTFAVVSYIIFVMTTAVFWPATQLSLAAADTARAEALSAVLTYFSWLTVSLVLLVSIHKLQLSTTWLRAALVSLALPALAALSSLSASAWGSGIAHPYATGGFLLILVSVSLIAALAITYEQTKQSLWRAGAISTIYFLWCFAAGLSWQVWHVLFVDDIALVLCYVTWALTTFALGLVVHHLHYPRGAWIGLQTLFAVPVLASLASLEYTKWTLGIIDVNAAGLYVMTVLLLVMGIGYRRELLTNPERYDYLKWFSNAFLIGSGSYAVAVVWVVTHATLATNGLAVAVALFVYTLAGLTCYLLGNTSGRRELKLVSAVLLTGVVTRLVLIDVWSMDPVWRIVTFMGIGALFIATALIEKPFEKRPSPNPPEPPVQ